MVPILAVFDETRFNAFRFRPNFDIGFESLPLDSDETYDADGFERKEEDTAVEIKSKDEKTEENFKPKCIDDLLIPSGLSGLSALAISFYYGNKKTIPKIDIFPYIFFPSSSKLIAANDNHPRYLVYRATFEFSTSMPSPRYSTTVLSPDYTHAEIYETYTSTEPYRIAFTETTYEIKLDLFDPRLVVRPREDLIAYESLPETYTIQDSPLTFPFELHEPKTFDYSLLTQDSDYYIPPTTKPQLISRYAQSEISVHIPQTQSVKTNYNPKTKTLDDFDATNYSNFPIMSAPSFVAEMFPLAESIHLPDYEPEIRLTENSFKISENLPTVRQQVVYKIPRENLDSRIGKTIPSNKPITLEPIQAFEDAHLQVSDIDEKHTPYKKTEEKLDGRIQSAKVKYELIVQEMTPVTEDIYIPYTEIQNIRAREISDVSSIDEIVVEIPLKTDIVQVEETEIGEVYSSNDNELLSLNPEFKSYLQDEVKRLEKKYGAIVSYFILDGKTAQRIDGEKDKDKTFTGSGLKPSIVLAALELARTEGFDLDQVLYDDDSLKPINYREIGEMTIRDALPEIINDEHGNNKYTGNSNYIANLVMKAIGFERLNRIVHNIGYNNTEFVDYYLPGSRYRENKSSQHDMGMMMYNTTTNSGQKDHQLGIDAMRALNRRMPLLGSVEQLQQYGLSVENVFMKHGQTERDYTLLFRIKGENNGTAFDYIVSMSMGNIKGNLYSDDTFRGHSPLGLEAGNDFVNFTRGIVKGLIQPQVYKKAA
ncbi:hypothetical protein JYT91_00060 [archaeon AH-315-M20]|nr:hypothetical protein [archaeon AH-315-M20]